MTSPAPAAPRAAPTEDRLSPLVFGAIVLAAVVLLAATVGWALPVVVLAVLFMVMFHEFGHYITAKRAGLLVTDFFVGFGPIVWSTTVGETRYGVRALPLGGYVKVPGMTWSDPVDPSIESRTYRHSSYPKRVLFAAAGSLMHFVLALVIAWAALAFIGVPSASHVGVTALSTFQGQRETPAQRAGLEVGDRIVSVDGRSITSATTLARLIHRSAGVPLTLVVERGGRRLTLHATPVNGQHVEVNGQTLDTSSRPEGFLGIEVGALSVRASILGAVPRAAGELGAIAVASVKGLAHVFTPHEFASLYHQVTSPAAAQNRQNQLNRPESIVGVVRIAVQGARYGVGTLLTILMAVNVFVGVFNLFPMLPLDGGYIAIATYERLRSRRGRTYHADVNRLLPVIYAFVTVLGVLFAATLYLDIVHPIANPFG
ncbi:MAG TPA: M50 family metallopeptidase [Acidimicrobiales bacterium]|nr:M50 family metallopeptidase [Acidimicrobiales bacterium]